MSINVKESDGPDTPEAVALALAPLEVALGRKGVEVLAGGIYLCDETTTGFRDAGGTAYRVWSRAVESALPDGRRLVVVTWWESGP